MAALRFSAAMPNCYCRVGKNYACLKMREVAPVRLFVVGHTVTPSAASRTGHAQTMPQNKTNERQRRVDARSNKAREGEDLSRPCCL